MATATMLLRIEGMTCDGCSQSIEQALAREEGVSEARVAWREGVAELTYDTALTDEERVLSNRIFKRQYRAKAVHIGGCC